MFLLNAADIDILRAVFWQYVHGIPKNHNFSELFSETSLNFFYSDSAWKKYWNINVSPSVEILTGYNYNYPKYFCLWSQIEQRQLEYAGLHVVVYWNSQLMLLIWAIFLNFYFLTVYATYARHIHSKIALSHLILLLYCF